MLFRSKLKGHNLYAQDVVWYEKLDPTEQTLTLIFQFEKFRNLSTFDSRLVINDLEFESKINLNILGANNNQFFDAGF